MLLQTHSNTDPPDICRVTYQVTDSAAPRLFATLTGSWALPYLFTTSLKINAGCFWSLMAPCLLADSNARGLWSWTLQIELCPWGKAISSSQEASFVKLKVEMTCEESFQWISKTGGKNPIRVCILGRSRSRKEIQREEKGKKGWRKKIGSCSLTFIFLQWHTKYVILLILGYTFFTGCFHCQYLFWIKLHIHMVCSLPCLSWELKTPTLSSHLQWEEEEEWFKTQTYQRQRLFYLKNQNTENQAVIWLCWQMPLTKASSKSFPLNLTGKMLLSCPSSGCAAPTSTMPRFPSHNNRLFYIQRLPFIH